MAEWLPIIMALLVTGVAAGILAGLLGVGGGIVIVPVLFLVFQSLEISASSAMSIATATSLMTIIPTSISSARSHHKRGNVDLALIKAWIIPMLFGVFVGSIAATRLDGMVLTLIFGVVAMAVALNMLLRAKAPPLFTQLPALPIQGFLASLVGLFSVLMGIGGGTLGVPIMTSFNITAHRAVGTAALFGLIIALPGSLILLFSGTTPVDAPLGTVGLVNLPGFALILPMTTLMAPIGVRIGSKLDGNKLKKVFACFLLLVASRMLFQALT